MQQNSAYRVLTFLKNKTERSANKTVQSSMDIIAVNAYVQTKFLDSPVSTKMHQRNIEPINILSECATTELSYIGRDCSHVPVHLAASHGKLIRRLDLSFNCLQSLEGLAVFGELEELILDNNMLPDTVAFPNMPRLHTLTMNKNKLKDLDGLLDKLANHLPSLTYLSLLGNEACPDQLSSSEKDDEDYQRYRYYVLYRLPRLKFLDSTQIRPKEKADAVKKGAFLKVVRPQDEDLVPVQRDEEDGAHSLYTPLPSNIREEPDHKATFGKCRYVYYGRHSEGNRFIRNNDL